MDAPMKNSTWLYGALLCAVAVYCGGAAVGWSGLFGSVAGAQTSQPGGGLQFTPVTLRIDQPPVPVKGSDGRFHVVYEIELTNFSGERAAIQEVSVLDARSGAVITSLDAAGIGERLVVRDRNAPRGTLGPSQAGILYLHIVFDSASAIPPMLAHRLSIATGSKTIVATGSRIAMAAPASLMLEAPLRGSRYIAGDGCCDSVRHVRASLPVNGKIFLAQRFAIDWEQLDPQGRIYVGDPKDPASYVIYGKPVYAVADARVAAAVDGLPDTPPGALPAGIPIGEADGNHVVLELGNGRYALFAHLKPGSIRVRADDLVRAGDVLGQVGTSGNSSEPHLHFHVTDGPSALASNGLPYLLRTFTAARRGVSTAGFDQSILDGKPIPSEPMQRIGPRGGVLPLDLWIVDFPS